MIKPVKTSTSVQESRLHFSDEDVVTLLQQVTDLSQHQQTLEQQATTYHQAYMTALGDAETELIDLKQQQLQQLISHAGSNQFSLVQRQQLVEWIIKDAAALAQHALADEQFIMTLIQKLALQLLVAAQQETIPSHTSLTLIRKVLAGLVKQDPCISTNDLLDLITSPEQLDMWLEQARQQVESLDDVKNDSPSWRQLVAPIMRDKSMVRLYRRLAHQLHPDKEQDEQRKQHKQALMQQLARAKKRHDLSTVLSLYQNYAKQSVRFDASMSTAISEVLKQQGIAFSQTYQRTLQANTTKMWAWRRFSQNELPLEQQLQQAGLEIKQEQARLTRALAHGHEILAIKQALQHKAQNSI